MSQALTFRQIRLAPTQSFFDTPLLRYVDCRTHEFTDLPSIVEYGTKNRVDVLQPCAGTHHAVIESITFLLNQCFQVPLNYLLPILRGDSLEHQLVRERTLSRVNFKNSEQLVRPIIPVFLTRSESPTARLG